MNILKKFFCGSDYISLEQRLINACSTGDVYQVKALEKFGARLNPPGGRPLRCAIDGCHLAVVRYLVREGGANVFDSGVLRSIKQLPGTAVSRYLKMRIIKELRIDILDFRAYDEESYYV